MKRPNLSPPAWVYIWLGAILLTFLAGALGSLLDAWDAWRATAAQLEQQQRAALQAQAPRDYAAMVQRVCGPESWYRAAPDGARICTDKRGRTTGHQLAGANP